MKHSNAVSTNVSRETRERLREYERLLVKWNRTINLVSRRSEAELWQRHFEDSLRLVPLMPEWAESATDMGSGAGFPGLVLALACGIRVDLLEADHRKAAFLREVIAATGAPAIVHVERIEQAALPPADVLTARALAPLHDLLRLGERLLKPGGVALFHKGLEAEAEIEIAATRWRMQLRRHRGACDDAGMILEISHISQAAGQTNRAD